MPRVRYKGWGGWSSWYEALEVRSTPGALVIVCSPDEGDDESPSQRWVPWHRVYGEVEIVGQVPTGPGDRGG